MFRRSCVLPEAAIPLSQSDERLRAPLLVTITGPTLVDRTHLRATMPSESEPYSSREYLPESPPPADRARLSKASSPNPRFFLGRLLGKFFDPLQAVFSGFSPSWLSTGHESHKKTVPPNVYINLKSPFPES